MGALGPDNPWMGLNVQSGHRKWGGVGRLYVLGPILSRERCSTGTVGTEKVPAGTFGGDSSIRFSDDGWWGRRWTVTHLCSLEFSEGSRNLRIFRAPFKILWVLMAGVCRSLCDYLVSGPVRVRALEQSTVTGTVCRVYLVPGPVRVRALAKHSNRHCLPCIVLVVGGCRPRGRHG